MVWAGGGQQYRQIVPFPPSWRYVIMKLPPLFTLWAATALWGCTTAQPPENDASSYQLLGGPCEGCEAIFEYGDRKLTDTDTVPGFADGKQQLYLTGTVWHEDGKTPAPGVILYVYQTNEKGIYEPAAQATSWAKRHGQYRGWVKTNDQGRYHLYTFRPAAYPSTTLPQHIHTTILEPDGSYYYVADFFFDDDPNLPDNIRYPDAPRGGTSGVLALQKHRKLWIGHRDIILRKNVSR
jgi:protocatechuate 3,4-dioxygenase beta subunit